MYLFTLVIWDIPCHTMPESVCVRKGEDEVLGEGVKHTKGELTMVVLSIYRKYHHSKLTFRMLYAFSENFVLPLSHANALGHSMARNIPDYQGEQVHIRLHGSARICVDRGLPRARPE